MSTINQIAQYRYGIYAGLTGIQRAQLDRKKVA